MKTELVGAITFVIPEGPDDLDALHREWANGGLDPGYEMRRRDPRRPARATKAARTRRVISGGPRRDASLNPIVARVRDQLLALVAEDYPEVRKYSEDQPRDELGRFGEGGGVEATADHGGAPRPGSWETIKDSRQIAILNTEWKGQKWSEVKADVERRTGTTIFGPSDSRETRMALAQYVALHEQFPLVSVRAIGSSMAPSGIATGRSTVAWYDPEQRTINLASAYWATPAGRINLMGDSAGFHPPGCDNPGGYMTHEFGHAVQHMLDFEAGGFAPSALGRDYLDLKGTQLYQEVYVSGYGVTSTTENFAEAFSSAYTPGAQGSELGTAIKDIFTKEASR